MKTTLLCSLLTIHLFSISQLNLKENGSRIRIGYGYATNYYKSKTNISYGNLLIHNFNAQYVFVKPNYTLTGDFSYCQDFKLFTNTVGKNASGHILISVLGDRKWHEVYFSIGPGINSGTFTFYRNGSDTIFKKTSFSVLTEFGYSFKTTRFAGLGIHLRFIGQSRQIGAQFGAHIIIGKFREKKIKTEKKEEEI